MQMDLLVFNVEHGLCAFVRTPSGHGIMIDAGCSDLFKPAEWLALPSNLVLTMHQSKRLAYLVVTHPHDDHVEGIASVKKFLQPAILLRHKDYDWNAVLNPPDGDPSRNAKEYYEWQKGYNQLATDLPELGCTFERFSLTPKESMACGGQLQNVLNNSSYVSVFTWPIGNGYRPWKLVICGDNEAKGLTCLLEKPGFRKAIANASVLVTPHHGHASGFNSEFMKALGNVRVCISSLPKKDPHHDQRYGDCCAGMSFFEVDRKHLTTRTDGHIWLSMGESSYTFKKVSEGTAALAGLLSLFK